MDLIQQIAGNLGVDPTQAQALAGGLLGAVQGQVAEHVGTDAAAQLEAKVPELSGWQAQAKAMLAATDGGGSSSGGGLLGSLAGLAGSGAGNDLLGALAGKDAAQSAQVVALLGKLGLDASKASLVAGPVLSFLKQRMPADWVDTALKAAPMLASLASGSDDGKGGGGLGGMLGGLLG
ncbi:MAG: hypothetical protein H6733_09795 [Alphaproteobacteria bacterium]|nr:hypothetical protein [Alphaproteobacteria bacterium]